MTGQGLVSLCLVYAMSPQVLVQAPGGRANARVVPKAYFELLSLRHGDGHFYLRPDRILCSMLVGEHLVAGPAQEGAKETLEQEAARDIAVQQQLAARFCDSVRRAEFLQQEFHRAESQVASPEAESPANDRPAQWGIWGAMLGASDFNPAQAPGRFQFYRQPTMLSGLRGSAVANPEGSRGSGFRPPAIVADGSSTTPGPFRGRRADSAGTRRVSHYGLEMPYLETKDGAADAQARDNPMLLEAQAQARPSQQQGAFHRISAEFWEKGP